MIRFGMGNLLNTYITNKARDYPIALYKHYIWNIFSYHIKILANKLIVLVKS